jgi:putative lipase involved disintegration of autophagic bodies
MAGSKSNQLNSFDSMLQVHKSFYNAEQSVISSVVVSQVNSLLKQHPGFNIIVAGHSLGAALAQLTGMDLIKWYFLTLANPAPEQKNTAPFRQRSSQQPATHDKDRVPHLPFEEQMSYCHVCREFFWSCSCL